MADVLRVLIADDNPDDRLLTIRQMRKEFPNLEALEIVNADDFERTMESADFDLVITDYQLNWTDGLAILRAVKAKSPDCPVIMFTGTGTEEIAVEAMKSGLEDYVLKSPKHLARLSSTARAVIDRAEHRRLALETEARYRRLFEEVPVGLYRATPEGHVAEANPTLVRMLGYPKRKTLLGTPIVELCADEEGRRHWRDLVKQRGETRGFEVRLRRNDGSIIWADHNVRSIPDPGNGLLYLEGSLADITERKNAEEALKESLEKLQMTTEGAIHALAATTETRDLYTAGHQRRVADIACLVAYEMGLSKDQTDGIRVAGMLHDIGKISVPAEILTKPARLTKIEYDVVKVHPKAGYDILKSIEFPWPIAEIVLQHHERMDGSGYPQGLSENAILIEARIMAVADTVEAMMSYRPYRPALGIEEALKEIVKNKEALFDADVVEACLALAERKELSDAA